MDKKTKSPKDPKLIMELSECYYNWLWKCKFPTQMGRKCTEKCKHFKNGKEK